MKRDIAASPHYTGQYPTPGAEGMPDASRLLDGRFVISVYMTNRP